MILEQYLPNSNDTWEWRLAGINDIDAIVKLAVDQFQLEIDQIFTPEPQRYAKNLALSVINQKFDKLSEQLIVAVDNGRLLGYAWIQRGQYLPYAPEELAEARFVHIDQSLPTRTRIRLLAQILQQWELWAQICGIKIICSSTIRSSQDAFLKLHERAGYSVRGSIAFKRIA